MYGQEPLPVVAGGDDGWEWEVRVAIVTIAPTSIMRPTMTPAVLPACEATVWREEMFERGMLTSELRESSRIVTLVRTGRVDEVSWFES